MINKWRITKEFIEVIHLQNFYAEHTGEFAGRKIFEGIEEPNSPYMNMDLHEIFNISEFPHEVLEYIRFVVPNDKLYYRRNYYRGNKVQKNYELPNQFGYLSDNR